MGASKILSRLSAHPWAFAAAIVILLAAHGLVFYFLQHLALSAAVASGLIVLIVVKHLGMFSSLYAILRKRFRKTSPSQ